MTSPRQYTLAVDPPHQPSLENFVVGANAELLQVLRTSQPSFAGYWIYGESGSGRSHLLSACCRAAREQQRTAIYIAGAHRVQQPASLLADLEQAARGGELVAIDDIDYLLGDVTTELLLMAIYQRLYAEQGAMLVSHAGPAHVPTIHTPDLASRLRSLQHFQILPLSDDHKMALLQARASHRGYELSQPVLDYWLARGPRSVGALLRDLEILDTAALAQQRKVTIPLLKRVLGY